MSNPLPDSGLENLPALSWTESSKWVVCGAGAALFAAGVVGLITNRKHAPQASGAAIPIAADAKATASRTPRPYLMLVGAGAVAVYFLSNLMQSPVATPPTHARQIPNLIWKLPPVPARIAWNLYSRMWEGVTPIKVPYNPAGGPWIVMEKAMVGFADSNGITIVNFAGAGSAQAYVCVRNKDASAMQDFVRLMATNVNPR